ncbi:MAG TPA: hypothetical protein V6C76_06705 [Drouetiella sp.]
MLEALATVIRMRREELRIPISYIALQLGVSEAHVLQFEAGQLDIDVISLKDLSRNLRISCSEVLALAEMMEQASFESKHRLKNRLEMRQQMSKMIAQNASLQIQLEKLELQRAMNFANREQSPLRSMLIDHEQRIKATKLAQDERELFLFRYLQNKAKLRNSLRN